MDDDLKGLLMFGLFMIVPALVILVIYLVIFARRGKFKRQRITSRGDHHSHSDKNT